MATTEEVKVLGTWASPFALRPRIALNLKGINYHYVEESLVNKSELLLDSNPVYKKIPVLLHNGKPISESPIIVQYIDEAWPATGPAILPVDAYERATARFWATYIDDKWFPAMKGVAKGPTSEAKEHLSAGMQFLEEAFEKCSKGKGFFGGDTIGYIDIAFGSYLGWVKVTEKFAGVEIISEEKTPLLAAWAERFCSAAAVKEVMPETERLLQYAYKIWASSVRTPAK